MYNLYKRCTGLVLQRLNLVLPPFAWVAAGVVLPVSERQEVLANGTLVVRQVSREADGGQYTCLATAGDNTARANLQVNVMGKLIPQGKRL